MKAAVRTSMMRRAAAVMLCGLVLLIDSAWAQQPLQRIATRGPVLNPIAGAVLADLTGISAGPHRFRIIASASTTTAVAIEWRDARRALKWQQGLMVPNSDTLVVPIDEEHEFADGDTLQIVVYANAQAGTVWASLSLK